MENIIDIFCLVSLVLIIIFYIVLIFYPIPNLKKLKIDIPDKNPDQETSGKTCQITNIITNVATPETTIQIVGFGFQKSIYPDESNKIIYFNEVEVKPYIGTYTDGDFIISNDNEIMLNVPPGIKGVNLNSGVIPGIDCLVKFKEKNSFYMSQDAYMRIYSVTPESLILNKINNTNYLFENKYYLYLDSGQIISSKKSYRILFYEADNILKFNSANVATLDRPNRNSPLYYYVDATYDEKNNIFEFIPLDINVNNIKFWIFIVDSDGNMSYLNTNIYMAYA